MATNPDTLGSSDASKPKKRLLSKNISALKFMQKGGAADVGEERVLHRASTVADKSAAPKRRVVVTESITFFDTDANEGRFSAQGFNAAVEKRRRAHVKAADRALQKEHIAEVEETRKRQAEIPDEEMAKRLRTFTRQPERGEADDDAAVSQPVTPTGRPCTAPHQRFSHSYEHLTSPMRVLFEPSAL